MIFRFDDICVNTNMAEANAVASRLKELFPSCTIIYAISPIVHSGVGERVFPKMYSAMSDHKIFYRATELGKPNIPDWVETAGHGLLHIDHRLLNKEAQEMSILTSCSIARSDIFVPPFNKWNKITEEVCNENSIQLIRFEDGWLSMEHNEYKEGYSKWYLHHRDFTLDKLNKWKK